RRGRQPASGDCPPWSRPWTAGTLPCSRNAPYSAMPGFRVREGRSAGAANRANIEALAASTGRTSGRTDMLKPTEAESVSAAPTAPSRALSEFLAALRFEAIPETVVARTEDLFLDWLASALAGKGARPTEVLQRFAAAMGPVTGPAEVLTSRARTSALFAAL